MQTQYQVITLIFGALAPSLALALTPCPEGTTTLPQLGVATLFMCVISGIALWIWLYVKIAKRTKFKNQIIVHVIGFGLMCMAIAAGIFFYLHFAVLTCF